MSQIHVCPLSNLQETLEISGAQHMISLAGPGKTEPRPAQITGAYLALEFNDIAEPRAGLIAPTQNDIYALINFFDQWQRDGPIVINCWMGISRSPAAAVIGCMRAANKTTVSSVAVALREASPRATPNPFMIRLADKELGLEGKLAEAIRSIGRGVDASIGLPFVLDTNSL